MNTQLDASLGSLECLTWINTNEKFSNWPKKTREDAEKEEESKKEKADGARALFHARQKEQERVKQKAQEGERIFAARQEQEARRRRALPTGDLWFRG